MINRTITGIEAGDPVRSGEEAKARITPTSDTVAIFHTHPRYSGQGARKANNVNRRPGELDHIAVGRGYPNYYRDPFGNIRVIERVDGNYRVRTIVGEDFKGQVDWSP